MINILLCNSSCSFLPLPKLLLVSIMLCSVASIGQSPSVSSGKIIRIENFQSGYASPRNVDIWVPNGYNPDHKYSVLYMHDGQMLFNSSATWNHQEWGVDETAGRLVAEEKIRPCIVVGIWNSGAARHSEYFPQKPFKALSQAYQDSLLLQAKRNESTALFRGEVHSDQYLRFIVKELKPYIDSTFSTLKDQSGTFIAGSSMGGLISLYAICEYPEVFGGAACLSTHWPGIFTLENNPIPSAFISYLKEYLPPPENHRIYFDYGTETLDSLYEPFQKQADEVMRQNGYSSKNWKTIQFKGENHSEEAWGERLDIPLMFLLASEE